MSITFRCDPPRIGLTAHLSTDVAAKQVGYNPGNLAFGYATAMLLGFPNNTHFMGEIASTEKTGVYACANLLGNHYDPIIFTNFINTARDDWRMALIGLGAQGPLDRLADDANELTLNASQIEWLTAVTTKAQPGTPNIAVRGGFTYDVLKKYGFEKNAIVTGCPSLMLSPVKTLGHTIAKKFSTIGHAPLIDGALGNPWDPHHSAFEKNLLKLVIDSGGVSHVQMDNMHLALARYEKLSDIELRKLRAQLSPQTSLEDMRNFGRKHLRAWLDLPSWMEHLRRVDFVFGSRIHGITLALQSGTPALCAAWDSRTLELCRAMNIPHISIYDEPWISGNFSFENIKEAFAQQFNPAAFDALRKSRAQQFIDFFTANNVSYSRHLIDIAAN